MNHNVNNNNITLCNINNPDPNSFGGDESQYNDDINEILTHRIILFANHDVIVVLNL